KRMKYHIVLIVVMILLPLLCPAQEIKLPVFFLYYDAGLGSEEITPEEGEEEEVQKSLSDFVAEDDSGVIFLPS
ncbi:hypothetical protein LCGC14_2762580, partial [marine sediment metagenome]